MVATCRTTPGKVLIIIDIHADIQSSPFSQFKKKNGERFYIERTSNMIRNEEGKPARIEGIFRYITERSRLVDEATQNDSNQSEQDV